MIGLRTVRRRAGESSGFTLIELLVVITLIAILGAVVGVGVQGFITTANQRARASQFDAVQKAVKAFVSTNIGPSGTLEQAKYPVKLTTGACDANTADATAPASNAYSETRNTGWYGADGSDLATQPTALNKYCYVDLYSTASTDLVAGGYVDKGSVKSPGVPGTAGAVFRCLFDSGSTTSATTAAANVRAAKGALLACRDTDAFTP